MSDQRQGSDEKKDRVFFVDQEQQQQPMRTDLVAVRAALDEKPVGAILPNGDINWNCPCLGGMVGGPCGYAFRQAFSCFHRSSAEPRGSDCSDAFANLHCCMSRYPGLFGAKEGEDDELDAAFAADANDLDEAHASKTTADSK